MDRMDRKYSVHRVVCLLPMKPCVRCDFYVLGDYSWCCCLHTVYRYRDGEKYPQGRERCVTRL